MVVKLFSLGIEKKKKLYIGRIQRKNSSGLQVQAPKQFGERMKEKLESLEI